MFCIACVLLPLANQISGPVETSQSNNSSDLITINNTLLDMMEYSGSGISLDNNLTNDTCHYSRLESSVGRNSIGRIPFRVWLTVSMIMIIMVIGRLVYDKLVHQTILGFMTSLIISFDIVFFTPMLHGPVIQCN